MKKVIVSDERLISRLMQERKTLKQLGASALQVKGIKDKGYNVKTELIGNRTYYWIKDVADIESQILISPRSSKLEKLSWAEISDIHAGSTHHDKKGLDWFLQEVMDRGIRHVHISGDMVDGNKVYPGQNNWLKYWRQEDQINELCDTLSKYPFDYYAIDGNHDFSWNRVGAPKVGKLVAERIKNFTYMPGKTENVFRGDLVIAGVMKRLVHPWSNSGRGTYALTYPAQTYLRNVFQGGLEFEIRDKKYKMQLLQYGHLHYEIEFTTFGVKVTHPLCFQKGNDYTEGKGLGGKTGGRLTYITVQDGEILDYDSKVLYVPERLK